MPNKTKNIVDGMILGLVVLMTNQFLPLCYLMGIETPRLCELTLIPAQLTVFFTLSSVVLLFLRYRKDENRFFQAWRTNGLLIVFLIFALLSAFWTVHFALTMSRAVLLLLISLVASYYGSRFGPKDLINYLAIMGGVIAVASVVTVMIRPDIAIMSNRPYEGLWRGVFWHKIYLGAVLALGYIALLFIVFSPLASYTLKQKMLAAPMAVISIVLAVLSDSATGLIIFVIQTILFGGLVLWLKFRNRSTQGIYLLSGAIALLLIVAAFLNLDILLGLFNRSTTLTGRIPLWNYLFSEYISKRPLEGYGFSAFWYQPGINARIQAILGWPYGIGVSDNGYMDILLGLGLPGLVLLVILLGTALWRSIRHALQQNDLMEYFPIFMLIHILLVNISLSYFMESESFIGFLLVVVLFMTKGKSNT
jgi:exopolysaccharide production protein ExoQ